MKGLPAETDFVVIGAGIAGLRAAIELAAAGSVLVLAKKEIDSSQSAQVTALSDEEWDPLESTCRHASLSIL